MEGRKIVTRKRIDPYALILVVLLAAAGYIIYFSASFGRLATSEELLLGGSFLKQLLIGVVGGGIALLACSTIPSRYIQNIAFILIPIAILINLLVVFTSLGIEAGGARRWMDLGFISFQPSELLKFVTIIVYATFLAKFRERIGQFRYGLLPLLIASGVVTFLMLLQKDTDVITLLALSAMFFVAGGKWRDLGILFLIGVIGVGYLAFSRPYIQARIMSFVYPDQNGLTTSYQLQQSLIAIGSGGMWGRGFGQSVQKFQYLPEPTGDSIFAVFAEEFGFAGTAILVILFSALCLRLLTLAREVKSVYARSVIIGFTCLIIGQSFMNMGAMAGILPLTGVPLAFISQGGTALVFALAGVGTALGAAREFRS